MVETTYTLEGKRAWVAGHRGMVGSAIVRRLAGENCEIITAGRDIVDLRRQADTEDWLEEARPDVIFLAAARVGGILANDLYAADFLYDNLAIETNVIQAAARLGVSKLLFLGSSCVYPKFAAQPIVEESLLTGALEPTNEWYAIAKIAGVKLVQAFRQQHGCDFISAMPCNLYGPNDNFDLRSSHVLAALLRRVHEAKTRGDASITLWGTGTPRREFLHADDCADALVHLMKNYSGAGPVNVGAGKDMTILELLALVKKVVSYEGGTVHDLTKPDGTPRKLMDSSRMQALGWAPSIGLKEGLRRTYQWLLDNSAEALRG